MTRSIKLAVAAAVALTSTAAFATNGDHLIGMGAKARGMGGVSIGMSHGAESGLANPANITTVKGTEISFGGTIFMPDVETNQGAGYSKSAADLSVIPEVAIAQNLGNGFSWGIGMFGTAGMGTDYRDATGRTSNMNMVTNLQLMQFAVPVAYKVGGFSIGVAPVLQYGSLDMNYDAAAFRGSVSETEGVAQDFGLGYNIGATYAEEGLMVGASYKSAIDMEYKGQLSAATGQFNTMFGAYGGFPVLSDNLEQPAEIGVGASYTFGGNTIAVDYKRIQWSNAKGYKDFGWEDQDVYMIGYQYAQDSWAVRAGYNHGSNPIKEQNGATPQGALLNTLNLLGFPAIVEDHYTIGGSYALSKATSIDLAYVYVPEATETYSTQAFTGMGGAPTISTKHSQDALSMQVSFAF
jgi:long-chain fatty acid transport protein